MNPRVLVTFLGLHDMPRFLSESGADLAGLMLAYTFLLTTRGTPLIYYGDEIAMRGGGDPDNRRDFPGGFPGDKQNAFDAQGRTAEQATIYTHARGLLQLRRELEPLRRGNLQILRSTGNTWVCVRRTPRQMALIAINNGTEPIDVDLAVESLGLENGRSLRERFPGKTRLRPQDKLLRVRLAARGSAVYSD